MSTQGIARMSRLKSIMDVSEHDVGMCATSKWTEGHRPDLDVKVLIVNDGEFTYTGRVPLNFDYHSPSDLRRELRQCFTDRWFARVGSYPCWLAVFVHGEMAFKLKFILRRRITSRFPRNDFQFKVSALEWHKLKRAFDRSVRPDLAGAAVVC